MSNYFDNQKEGWSWICDGESVKVMTDHGDHVHTLDLSHATIGDMYDNLGQTMGDAHRASSHDKK